MEDFMNIAYKLAQKAFKKGEVPIGAVIVKNGKIIAMGYNKRQKTKNAINHAEIIAIQKACKKLHTWHLVDCDMYVTLEPCPMCAGAIINSRINNVFIGAKQSNDDENLCEKILNNKKILNHKTNLIYFKNDFCSNIISEFFSNKRK